MIRCPDCQHANGDNARFCISCGTQLGTAADQSADDYGTEDRFATPNTHTNGIDSAHDPYAPPEPEAYGGGAFDQYGNQYDDDYGPGEQKTDRERVRGRAMGAGIALIVAGSLNAIQSMFFLLVAGMALLDPAAFSEPGLYENMAELPIGADEISAAMVFAVYGGMALFSVLGSVFMIWGGANLLSLKGWSMPFLGALSAVIPCTSLCCWLPVGMVAGIWAFVVIAQSDVSAVLKSAD